MEINVNVKIEIGENSKLFATGLIASLLNGMANTQEPVSVQTSTAVPVVAPTPVEVIPTVQQTVVPAAPVAVAPVQAAPIQAASVVQAVPVAPVSYTQEQLALAATTLVDAGRMLDVQNILAGFGVQTLLQLPKEQYGNFAAQLRALGVKI